MVQGLKEKLNNINLDKEENVTQPVNPPSNSVGNNDYTSVQSLFSSDTETMIKNIFHYNKTEAPVIPE
jgi:hypothetical protein